MQRLGMRAPDGLDAATIAERAGRDMLVPTINVETQQSGPRMTLGQWAEYFGLQPVNGDPRGRHRRQPLLNVVSLSLAGTPLQVRAWTGRIQSPSAPVRAIHGACYNRMQRIEMILNSTGPCMHALGCKLLAVQVADLGTS